MCSVGPITRFRRAPVTARVTVTAPWHVVSLWRCVCQFLSTPEHLQLRHVCQAWKQTVDSGRTWYRLELVLEQEPEAYESAHRLLASCKAGTEAESHHRALRELSLVMDTDEEEYLHHIAGFKKLNVLKFSSIAYFSRFRVLERYFTDLTELRFLSLDGVHLSTQELVSVCRLTPRLEVLKLSWVTGPERGDDLGLRPDPSGSSPFDQNLKQPSLKHLEVQYATGLSLVPLLSGSPQLETLLLEIEEPLELDLARLVAWVPRLRTLKLGKFTPRPWHALSGLTRLECLNLNECGVTWVQSLGTLTGLQHLSFRQHQVTDLSPLSQLTRLRFLNASEGPVADLSPLAACRELRMLNVYHTPATDLSPLKELPFLDVLAFGDADTDLDDLMEEWSDFRRTKKRRTDTDIHTDADADADAQTDTDTLANSAFADNVEEPSLHQDLSHTPVLCSHQAVSSARYLAPP